MGQEPKKKYETPKIYRVVLKHDQAILSGCHATPSNVSNTTGTFCDTSCRRASTSSTATNSSASS
jgi:hypothetical protein